MFKYAKTCNPMNHSTKHKWSQTLPKQTPNTTIVDQQQNATRCKQIKRHGWQSRSTHHTSFIKTKPSIHASHITINTANSLNPIQFKVHSKIILHKCNATSSKMRAQFKTNSGQMHAQVKTNSKLNLYKLKTNPGDIHTQIKYRSSQLDATCELNKSQLDAKL